MHYLERFTNPPPGLGGRRSGDCSFLRSAPPNLNAWWPADDNELDIVNGNDGILRGGASFDDGIVAQAFALNGIDA